MASRKRCQRWLKSGTRRRLLRLLGGRNGLSRVFRVGALEHDDGNPPARSLAVFVEARHLPGVLSVEALVVLLAVDHAGPGLERLTLSLDLDDRVAFGPPPDSALLAPPRRNSGIAPGSAWWRRRELNPRPKQRPPRSLRACPGI